MLGARVDNIAPREDPALSPSSPADIACAPPTSAAMQLATLQEIRSGAPSLFAQRARETWDSVGKYCSAHDKLKLLELLADGLEDRDDSIPSHRRASVHVNAPPNLDQCRCLAREVIQALREDPSACSIGYRERLLHLGTRLGAIDGADALAEREQFLRSLGGLHGKEDLLLSYAKSFSRLGVWDISFSRQISAHVAANPERFSRLQLARLAQLDEMACPSDHHVLGLAIRRIGDRPPRQRGEIRARLKSAASTFSLKDLKFACGLAGIRFARAEHLPYPQICACLSALGNVGADYSPLVVALMTQASRHVQALPARDILPGLKKVADSKGEFGIYYRACALRLRELKRTGNLSDRQAVAALTAFSEAGYFDEANVQPLMEESAAFLSVHPQEISVRGAGIVLRNLIDHGSSGGGLAQILCSRIVEGIEVLSSEARIALINAMLHRNYDWEQLSESIVASALVHPARLTLTALIATTHLAADFRIDGARDLVSVCRERLSAGDHHVTLHELAELFWAAAMCQSPEGESLWGIVKCRLESHRKPIDASSATRILHSLLAGNYEVAEELRSRIIKASKMQHNPPSVSEKEKEIKEKLLSLGLQVGEQQPIAGYLADFVIVLDGQLVNLEYDGAWAHCIGGDISRGYRGKNIMRDEILEQLGYRVLRLLDAEYEMLCTAQELSEWISRSLPQTETSDHGRVIKAVSGHILTVIDPASEEDDEIAA